MYLFLQETNINDSDVHKVTKHASWKYNRIYSSGVRLFTFVLFCGSVKLRQKSDSASRVKHQLKIRIRVFREFTWDCVA